MAHSRIRPNHRPHGSNSESEIDGDTGVWRIKVKMVYKWETTDDNGKVTGLHMILLDEQKCKIQASIPKYYLGIHTGNIHTGGYYYLERFKVFDNLPDYKPTPHTHKISFTRVTVFDRCFDMDIPYPLFNFSTFEEMSKDTFDNTVLTDVIGEVTEFYGWDPASQKSITLELFDDTNKSMRVKLWDNYAKQVHEFITASSNRQTFNIIIRFAKVKKFKGVASLTNAYCVTRIYMGKDCKQAGEDFIKKRREIVGYDPIELKETSYSIQEANETYFLNTYPIYDVKDIPSMQQEGQFATIGNIVGIESDYDWFYSSCQYCVEPIHVDNKGNLSCQVCKVEIDMALPRFKVFVKVLDLGYTTTFVLFDASVRTELGITAKEIRDKQWKNNEVHTLPEELEHFLGGQYVFIFKVSEKYNIIRRSKSYSVTKMTDDEDILKKFQIKLIMQKEAEILKKDKDKMNCSTTDDNSTAIPSKRSSESMNSPIEADASISKKPVKNYDIVTV